MRVVSLLIGCLILSGCVGKVVSTVVTAPIKVVGKTVDVMTTSQDEADRNRGRKARKAEQD
jgi:PBP1b-binding outer membrane lipoprotein LpoB